MSLLDIIRHPSCFSSYLDCSL